MSFKQVELPLATPSARTMFRAEGDAATLKNYTEECRALAQSMGLRLDVAAFPAPVPIAEEEPQPATPRPPALGPKPEGGEAT